MLNYSYFLGGLREEAEGVVTETMSFRHEDPFNADEQDTSLTISRFLRQRLNYSLFYYAKISHHAGFSRLVKFSKIYFLEIFSVICGEFSFANSKESFCNLDTISVLQFGIKFESAH